MSFVFYIYGSLVLVIPRSLTKNGTGKWGRLRLSACHVHVARWPQAHFITKNRMDFLSDVLRADSLTGHYPIRATPYQGFQEQVKSEKEIQMVYQVKAAFYLSMQRSKESEEAGVYQVRSREVFPVPIRIRWHHPGAG